MEMYGKFRGFPRLISLMVHCLGLYNDPENYPNNPGCLGYIRDYTTQLYRDYNKPLRIPIKQPVFHGK